MNNSFLLKDKSGRASGYLMQCGKQIRLRTDVCRGEDKKIILYAANGESESKLISDSGEEVSWESRIEKLKGAAVVTLKDEILLSTGKQIDEICSKESTKVLIQKRRNERIYETQKSSKKEVDQSEKEAAQIKETAEFPQKENKNRAKVWPDRRWPPPPCMTDAQYTDGKWRHK